MLPHFFFYQYGFILDLKGITGQVAGHNAVFCKKTHQAINLDPSSQMALSFQLRVSMRFRVKRTSADDYTHFFLQEKPVLCQIWLLSYIKQLRP